MKINKAKLLVGTLAIASVAATVGSISGTVAWFQYNTRAAVEYQGTTVHCTESLQVSLTGEANSWSQTLNKNNFTKDILGRSIREANQLAPVTSGGLDLDKAPVNLYSNPIYQYAGNYPVSTDTDLAADGSNKYWKVATKEDYVEFPVYLRVLDIDGTTSENLLAKKVYLSDVTIAAADSTGNDMSSAVRVAVYNSTTISAATGFGTYANADLSAGTAVSGNLDLNNDGVVDTAQKYSFQTAGTPLTYGTSGALAKAYGPSDLADDASTHKIADDSDPYAIKGKELGSTVTTGTMFAIKVRIYVEGWSELDGTKFGAKVDGTTNNATNTKVWDVASMKAVKFNVGLRFSAETHSTHAEPTSSTPTDSSVGG